MEIIVQWSLSPNKQPKGNFKMKLNVFEDGDKVDVVDVDISNLVEIKRVFDEYFDCGKLEDDEIEISITGDEVYIALNECQYLWNKE